MNSPRGLSLSAQSGVNSRELDRIVRRPQFLELGNFDDLVHFYLRMPHTRKNTRQLSLTLPGLEWCLCTNINRDKKTSSTLTLPQKCFHMDPKIKSTKTWAFVENYLIILIWCNFCNFDATCTGGSDLNSPRRGLSFSALVGPK